MKRRLIEALARRSQALGKAPRRPVLAYFWDLVRKVVRPVFPRAAPPGALE